MANQSIYTVGGTVSPDSELYIPRQADAEALALCRAGAFAYILTSRQMGKSSLMVRTARLLAEEGIRSVLIDLTEIGVGLTAEEWYYGLLTKIKYELDLKADVYNWWQSHHRLGLANRLTLFFRDILLAETAERVVIFVDEIDSTLGLPFTDDFYAAIRYFYNARTHVPEFKRLSFVLIGVATPADLIGDPKRTPFNIGQRVDLSDFTFKEARPFGEGLGLRRGQALQILGWVLKWTGGHPYLTQRLCQVIADQRRSHWSEAEVDQVVTDTFFGEKSKQDNNLQFVRDMLTRRAPDLAGVLSLYRAVRLGLYDVPDEEHSPLLAHLKLSGIVRSDNGVLHVRNKIYARVFDVDWIEEVEARQQVADPRELAQLRALAEAQEKQVEAERQQAEEARRRAQAERQRAGEQQRRAELERQRAAEQTRAAAQLRRRALWLSAALFLTMLTVVVAIIFGLQAQINAETAANAEATALAERGNAQSEANRAINAEATAEANRATAQAEAMRALNAEATARAERGIAEGKSMEALDAEATARAEAVLAGIARGTAQAEATRSAEAEALAQTGATAEAIARAAAQAESTRSNQAEASAQAEATRSAAAEATARAEASRADQSRSDAEAEARRARDAEDAADESRATAEHRGTLEAQARQTAEFEATRAFEAEQTAQAQRDEVATAAAAAQTAEAKEASARATAEAQRNTATSLLLSNLALDFRDEQYDLSLLLSLEAYRIADTVESRSILLESLQSNLALTAYLRDHNNPVNSVAFSPDGQSWASGSCSQVEDSLCRQGEVRLWSLIGDQTSSLVLTAEDGHTGVVQSVAFNKDGHILASGDAQGRIILWDVTDRQAPTLMAAFASNLSEVRSLAFNPVDGDILAASGSSNVNTNIILWNITDLTAPLAALSPFFAPVNSLAFSSDGQLLAAGGNKFLFDEAITLWQMGNLAAPLIKFSGANVNQVYSLAFKPDDDGILAAGNDNNSLSLWQLADLNNPVELKQLSDHTGPVRGVAFNKDGDLLASGSQDNTLILWDTTNPQDPRLLRRLIGHTGDVLSLAFNPGTVDGQGRRMLVSGSSDRSIILWDVGAPQRLGQIVGQHTGPVLAVDFGRDLEGHTTLASAGADRTIILWDITNPENPGEISRLSEVHQQSIMSLAFSQDGLTLASGSADGTIILWDMAERENPLKLRELSAAHANSVLSLAFSPQNDQLLASSSADNDLRLWNVDQIINDEAPQPIADLTNLPGDVYSLAFSSDGQVLASGSDDTNITLWDVNRLIDDEEPKQLSQLSTHNGIVYGLAFGQFQASGSQDQTVILASGSQDQTVNLWEVTTPTEPRLRTTFNNLNGGHSGQVFSVDLSPDGRKLASGSADKTVILFDAVAGRRLGQPFIEHAEGVRSVAFSPDGRWLASGSDDQTVILWAVEVEAWRTLACQMVNRNLTEDELSRFVPDAFRQDRIPPCPNVPGPQTDAALAPVPAPLPTPTATATATPTPTSTPTPSATATPTTGPTLTPEPPATATETATPIPSTPTSTPAPALTSTLSPTPTASPALTETPAAPELTLD